VNWNHRDDTLFGTAIPLRDEPEEIAIVMEYNYPVSHDRVSV
jgi:hypothetical protein